VHWQVFGYVFRLRRRVISLCRLFGLVVVVNIGVFVAFVANGRKRNARWASWCSDSEIATWWVARPMLVDVVVEWTQREPIMVG